MAIDSRHGRRRLGTRQGKSSLLLSFVCDVTLQGFAGKADVPAVFERKLEKAEVRYHSASIHVSDMQNCSTMRTSCTMRLAAISGRVCTRSSKCTPTPSTKPRCKSLPHQSVANPTRPRVAGCRAE